MKPLKVDFLIRSLGQGGAERQLMILASGLAGRGHQVRILTFYSGGHYETEARARGLTIINLHKKGRWDLIPFLLRLALAWQDYQPDLIHSYMSEANLVSTLLKPWHRRPLVWGLRASQLDLSQYDWLARATDRLEGWGSSWADLIIANSEAGRAHALARGFPASRLCVADNGFECAQWIRDPEAGRAFRSAHGLPLDPPILGLVGRVDPAKGHAVFLQAAARLTRTHPQVHYLLVGEDPWSQRDRMKTLGASLGIGSKVHWLPGQRDMVAVYSALDGLVSASLSEGFPNVLAEAMACGLRPVATAVGDSARVVGPCGWVVPPGDAEALAAGMGAWLEACESRRAWPGPDPRAHIEGAFGVDRLVIRTEARLQGVQP